MASEPEAAAAPAAAAVSAPAPAASTSFDGQAVLVFGRQRAELSAALSAKSGGTTIDLETLVQLASNDPQEEAAAARLQEALLSTDVLVPFKLALPLLLRLFADRPPPFFVHGCVRTAAHVKQLQSSASGRLGLAVQAGDFQSSSDRTLSSFLAKNDVVLHATTSCSHEDVALVLKSLEEVSAASEELTRPPAHPPTSSRSPTSSPATHQLTRPPTTHPPAHQLTLTLALAVARAPGEEPPRGRGRTRQPRRRSRA